MCGISNLQRKSGGKLKQFSKSVVLVAVLGFLCAFTSMYTTELLNDNRTNFIETRKGQIVTEDKNATSM